MVTALGKEVGHELRVRREKAGYNALELSNRLGWPPTKVAMAETGAWPLTDVDLTMYLASCGVEREEVEEILDLAKEGDMGYRLKDHTDDIKDESGALIFHERSAMAIVGYEPIVVPPLLQTEGYARALLVESGICRSVVVDHRMSCLADRQATLHQSKSTQYTFFIHENVLSTPVGDNLVMCEQMTRLMSLGSRYYCTVRVVPRSVKAAGLAKNGFQRMVFSDRDPMVTVDLESNTLFLDNTGDTSRYGAVLARLDHVALDEEQSRAIFDDLADNFDGAQNVNLPLSGVRR